jgi:1-deoxy-D-xylulose-5-phosphate reductoisomerase
MKGVAILGGTGSIGRSALAVLDQHPDRFRLVAVTARSNLTQLEAIVDRTRPRLAVLTDGDPGHRTDGSTRWLSGQKAMLDAVMHPEVDIVLNAMVGAAGLEPTITALRSGKRVALANKESLVCGGPLVMAAAEEGGGELVPVDSEHSAILQCIQGYGAAPVERVILTASGGPFRQLSQEALERVSRDEALRHPTWAMGAKVTIDSATLANKALEVIEAHFLFRLGYDRIAAVVHPQSIIHAMVEFVDGSVIAQMGFPSMELPILYALGYPERLPYRSRRYDPVAAGALTFEPIREHLFPAFRIGVEAGKLGGAYPALFNAANEVAVSAFLAQRLGFSGIPKAIDSTLQGWHGDEPLDIGSVLEVDRQARVMTETFIARHKPC